MLQEISPPGAQSPGLTEFNGVVTLDGSETLCWVFAYFLDVFELVPHINHSSPLLSPYVFPVGFNELGSQFNKT